MGTSFNRIHYDHFRKRIHLWETVDGKRFSDEVDIDLYYYVEDQKNESKITDIYGNKVVKRSTRDMNSIRQLRESGIALCESDISQEMKFLHDRYEGVELKPDINDFQICYIDIEVEVEGGFDAKAYRYPINLITVKLSKQGKSYTFGNKELKREIPGRNFKAFATEKELLEGFVGFFNKAKIDIVSGWNVQFDISTIINRANQLGVKLSLAPVGKYWFNERTEEWSIPGIAILDYMQFFKDPKFTQEKKESYTLQAICMAEIGEGKIDLDGQINSMYKTDWEKFVEYNIQDTELVEKLEKKKRFIELAVNLTHKSMIPIDKVFSASAVIEGRLLSFLHDNGMVMNDKVEGMVSEKLNGGYVESQQGYYEKLLSYDFEGLYPILMRIFNIGPDTLVMYPSNPENYIKTPLSKDYGIYFRREKGVFCKILEQNTKERNEFKNLKKKYEAEGNKELTEYYDSQQLIRKIFNNSFYGVLALSSFHYYNINNAKTVTGSGQDIIKFIRDKVNLYFNDYFHKDERFFQAPIKELRSRNRMAILDTDSLYIDLSDVKKILAPEQDLLTWSNEFNKEFLTPFFVKLLDKYFKQFGVENIINFKMEKVISQMIVFGDKNYATIILANEGVTYKEPKLTITGFASKRSDKPSFCREKIKEMVKVTLKHLDRKFLIEQFKDIKKEFCTMPIEQIASPKGISDYNKYARDSEVCGNRLKFVKGTPFHSRAAIIYNHLVKKHNLPHQPVDSGSKIKYIYVKTDNELNENVVAFLGKCPDYIKENFKIDYDLQFEKTFLSPMQKLFDSMGWDNIDIETKDISEFFD